MLCPSPQAAQLRPLLESGITVGEEYSLISSKWLQQWKEYTKYDAATNEHYFDAFPADRPGPIANEVLSADDNPQIIK